jgi:glycosyltransferase involved in cell wall biosynthesis
MKVLVSAFSCCPGRGSEPGIGWNWVWQISRRHEVWLITTEESEGKIRQHIPANVHATFLPSFERWNRLQQWPVPGLDWVYYYWWQWKAYRLGRRLHAQVGFDLVHHATFGSWRAPSFLCRLPVPFIWGPVGGGEASAPWRLQGGLGLKGRLMENVRELCQHISRCDPFVRQTMKRAAVILTVNRDTARLMPRRLQHKVQSMAAAGILAAEKSALEPPASRPPGFVVLYVSMLQPRKGAMLALRAFARLAGKRPEAALLIIGDGEDRRRMEEMVQELGLTGRVRFLGLLPRPQVMGWMSAADALLHPSLRDSGGLVILEAMMAGKPVVCLDLGGPGEFVTSECGFKVHPGTPEQVVADLAAALEKIAGDPALSRALGEAGRRRVLEHFDWDKRGERMMEIYRQVAR